MTLSTGTPTAAWIPHRAPMLMVDTLEEISHGYCRTHMTVDGSAWYALADGAMPAWYGLELMAQTISTYSGHRKLTAHQPMVTGYLLGTQEYQSSLPSFPAGAGLEIEARLHFWDELNLSAFRCIISHQGVAVASAILKVLEKS